MRRLSLAFLVQLVSLAPAFAAEANFNTPPISPAAPLASDAITARVIIRVACNVPPIWVERSASGINLYYMVLTDCPSSPSDHFVEVELGTFAEGVYEMHLFDLSLVCFDLSPFLRDTVTFTVAAEVVPEPFAQVRFAAPPVSPALPTSSEPVTAKVIARVACNVPSFAVERSGYSIDLRYQITDDCSSSPIDHPVDVALGVLPAGTYDLRVLDIGSGSPVVEDEAAFTVTDTSCDEGLCLQSGRFAVTAQWVLPDGTAGSGTPHSSTPETGALWFFDPGNLELFVKVLDGCGVNGRYWVFVAGLTNVQVEVRMHDELLGTTATYTNPQGTLFQPIADTDSFPCTAPASE
jgi:hypothetical protein